VVNTEKQKTMKSWIPVLTIERFLENLKSDGYRLWFRREATCIYCTGLKERISPEEFKVDMFHYFQDNNNPDGDRIIFSITLTNGRKGFLIEMCNVYADNISYEMEQRLRWTYPSPLFD